MMPIITPMFASGALRFAFEKATVEGKITISALVVVSIFSWTVIFNKARQLYIARKAGRKFFATYRDTRDPLDLHRRQEDFSGAPAYELYETAAEELDYHLKNNPIQVNRVHQLQPGQDAAAAGGHTDRLARSITTK